MNDSGDISTFRALHRLVEHYTPDEALGRTLLGGTALAFAPFLFLGGATILYGGAVFPILVFGLFSFLVSIPAFAVGVMALWPVYLSLIGNVESAGAYPEAATGPGEDPESAEAVLKRRYAAGELTREEFERRLSDVMGPAGPTRDRSETDSESRREGGRDGRRERSRSRS